MPLAMRSEIMRTMALFCGSWGRSRGMGRVSSRYSRMASCSEGTLRQGEGLGSLDQRGEASKLPFCNVWYHHSLSLLSWSAIRSFGDLAGLGSPHAQPSSLLPSTIYLMVPTMLGPLYIRKRCKACHPQALYSLTGQW